MKVRYIHEKPGIAYGNIMWDGSFPMRGGQFPANHPCTSEAMERFNQIGYWASRFPEGDGITMKVLRGQTPDQVIHDITECFGFEAAQ